MNNWIKYEEIICTEKLKNFFISLFNVDEINQILNLNIILIGSSYKIKVALNIQTLFI